MNVNTPGIEGGRMQFYLLRSLLRKVWWFRQQPLSARCSHASTVLWLLCIGVLGSPSHAGDDCTEMGDERLVNIEALIPGIRLDIRYATVNNFTQRKLYPIARCYLRKRVAERLAEVQQELQAQGLGLKAFDCYRPLSIQKQLWALLPDERYVIDPRKGSRHNRGAAVDVTLVDVKGNELVCLATSFARK